MTYPGPDTFPGDDLYPGGPPITLEVAWGHTDLTTDPDSWDWTDITGDVRVDPGVSWRFGRSDESSTANPAELTAVLNNPDYRYSLGGRSANYPYVRKNTPVRLTVEGTTAFLGYSTGWSPSWDESLTGQIPTVQLTASGTLRRLGQGTDPVISPLRRYLMNEPDVVAYWPCEEGKDANVFPPSVGKQEMAWTGETDLASCDLFAGSLPVPTMNGDSGIGGSFGGDVDTYTPAADFSQGVRMLLALPDVDSKPDDEAVLFQVRFASGTVRIMQVMYESAGVLAVRCYSAGFGSLVSSASATFNIDDKPGLISLEMFQSGGTVHYGLNFLGYGATNYGSIPGDPHYTGSLGRIARVEVDPAAAISDVGFGHVAVLKARSNTDPLTDVYYPLNGHPWEVITSVAGRISRLADENNIVVTYYSGVTDGVGTGADYAGAQHIDDVVTLLQNCATQERGILWDGLDPGLAYTTRRRLENATPSLTINADQLVAFAPVDDDQRTRNRVTVTRDDGAAYTYEDTDGPLGTETIGIYSDSTSINAQMDGAARDLAGWLVHSGTIEGYRYPSVTLNLLATPELIEAVLDLYVGARVDIMGLSGILFSSGDDTVSLTVEGVSHTRGSHEWTVELTCSPFEVWRLTTLDDTRLDADNSALIEDYFAGDTAITVDGEPWTSDPGDYPLVLDVGGIPINATACTAPVSTGGPATVRDRAKAKNDTPSTSHTITLPTDVEVDDLLLVAFTNDVASVTASTTSTGWTRLITRSQGSGTTTQLGQTSNSGSTSASSANKTVVSKFTAAANATVMAGHARLWVDTGTADVEMVVYADSAGAPDALLALSNTVTISNTSEALVDFVFTGANQAAVVNGTDYWIGFTWPDPGTNSVSWSRNTTGSAALQNSLHAASSFGSSTTLTGPIDAYVDITTAATNHSSAVFWKRATGSDSLTVTTTASQESTHVSLSIYNAGDPQATGADGGSASSGTAPAISPSGGTDDYLAVVIVGTDSSSTTSQVVTPPSGYSNLQSQNPGITSSAATFTMERSYTATSTITPGSFSLGTAEQWIAFTVAIPGTELVSYTDQTFTVDPLPVGRSSGTHVSVWNPPHLGL